MGIKVGDRVKWSRHYNGIVLLNMGTVKEVYGIRCKVAVDRAAPMDSTHYYRLGPDVIYRPPVIRTTRVDKVEKLEIGEI